MYEIRWHTRHTHTHTNWKSIKRHKKIIICSRYVQWNCIHISCVLTQLNGKIINYELLIGISSRFFYIVFMCHVTIYRNVYCSAPIIAPPCFCTSFLEFRFTFCNFISLLFSLECTQFGGDSCSTQVYSQLFMRLSTFLSLSINRYNIAEGSVAGVKNLTWIHFGKPIGLAPKKNCQHIFFGILYESCYKINKLTLYFSGWITEN